MESSNVNRGQDGADAVGHNVPNEAETGLMRSATASPVRQRWPPATLSQDRAGDEDDMTSPMEAWQQVDRCVCGGGGCDF